MKNISKTIILFSAVLLISSLFALFVAYPSRNDETDEDNIGEEQEEILDLYGVRELSDLSRLIEEAKISDLMQIHYLIGEYCSQEEFECEEIDKDLKRKGDQLKDELFSEIKEDDPDFVKKLSDLQALLMSQRTASGEDQLFSTSNIEEVNRKTKEKMKKRFLEILKGEDLNRLHQELIFVLSQTPASCETEHYNPQEKSPSDFGLFYWDEICDLSKMIREKIRLILWQSLSGLDLCLLTQGDIGEIQDRFSNCDLMVGNQEICEDIEAGRLDQAYNNLITLLDLEEEELNCSVDGITTEIKYFEDPIIGWDFSISPDRNRSIEFHSCVSQCGDIPLRLLDPERLLCQNPLTEEETECWMRPLPSQESRECYSICFEERTGEAINLLFVF